MPRCAPFDKPGIGTVVSSVWARSVRKDDSTGVVQVKPTASRRSAGHGAAEWGMAR